MIMKEQNLNLQKAFSDQKPALFLDRDGVINVKIDDDYVKTWEEFRFVTGTPEAIRILSGLFSPIVIVTNQQGIGKKLMTEESLHEIHRKMMTEIKENGGRIDKIYFCGDLKDSGSPNRKPEIGMGLQAKSDFPSIRFKNAVMAGDTVNDMLFGKRLGMTTVFISGDEAALRRHHHLIDYRFNTLLDFARTLSEW